MLNRRIHKGIVAMIRSFLVIAAAFVTLPALAQVPDYDTARRCAEFAKGNHTAENQCRRDETDARRELERDRVSQEVWAACKKQVRADQSYLLLYGCVLNEAEANSNRRSTAPVAIGPVNAPATNAPAANTGAGSRGLHWWDRPARFPSFGALKRLSRNRRDVDGSTDASAAAVAPTNRRTRYGRQLDSDRGCCFSIQSNGTGPNALASVTVSIRRASG